jgi:hypothetical protein
LCEFNNYKEAPIDLKPFQLDPKLIATWTANETDFKSSLRGWNSITAFEKEPYAHMYAIRKVVKYNLLF